METSTAIEAEIEKMLADGWSHYEHENFKPGTRVHNTHERYYGAHLNGTAEVVAVVRKPGPREQKYGRLNLEVLVKRDRDGLLGWWADYGTSVAMRQEAPDA